MVEPINVANLWVNQRPQINEDIVEPPSLAAQDINIIAYVPDLISHAGFVLGSVQLIRPVGILSLAVTHSTARPNRQPGYTITGTIIE